jgi:hypothetical protein
MKNRYSEAFRYFILPALLYLTISLMGGMWIRLQWAVPTWTLFTTKFMIHAHSHLALLGWLFLALFRLLLPKSITLSLSSKVVLWLLHGTVITMFPAFLFQGYAFWSITLSTLFLIISYVLIYQFRKELKLGSNFLNSIAIGFYILSTIGPWALGGATRFGTEWLNAWIAFFLHLQFNGWVTFAILAILFKHIHLDKYSRIGISLIAFSSFIVTPGFMYSNNSPLWQGVVAIGSILMIIGLLMSSFFLIKNSSYLSTKSIFISLFLIKTGLISLVSFDVAQTWIHHIHSFRVAFTHFVLLSWASSVILFALFGQTRLWLLFFASALLKGSILGLEAFQIIPILHLPFSIQWIYVFLGSLMLASLIGLIYQYIVTKVPFHFSQFSEPYKAND